MPKTLGLSESACLTKLWEHPPVLANSSVNLDAPRSKCLREIERHLHKRTVDSLDLLDCCGKAVGLHGLLLHNETKGNSPCPIVEQM